MKKNHFWNDEERAIIRRDYKHTTKSAQQIAEYLSRITGDTITEFGVKGQISIMGIAKSDDRHPWTPEEEAKLAYLVPKYNIRLVAKKMHRSINSVVVKSTRLKLSRRCRDGWFTKAEVMAILGHDHKWVQVRIDSKALKASYHYGPESKPGKLGSHVWHIEEKDLKAYIRRYPEDLVGCNVDIMMIVDILAGVTNNNH